MKRIIIFAVVGVALAGVAWLLGWVALEWWAHWIVFGN